MNLSDQLKKVIALLADNKTQYALAGGVVASLFREDERLTADLDFLILANDDSEKTALGVLRSLDLDPMPLSQAELQGGPLHAIKNRTTPTWMICGMTKDKEQIKVDFLLPTIPWFQSALKRAQFHQIDFGFAIIPCLTLEDIIISKLYSFSNRSDRFKDLDDLQSIFRAIQKKKRTIDLSYLSDRMNDLESPIPETLRKVAPKELLRFGKVSNRKRG